MSKKLNLIIAVFVASLAMGWVMAPSNPEVNIAHAACGPTYSCTADNTATSSLTVGHRIIDEEPEGGNPVEPDDGETWSVVATWSSNTTPIVCQCLDLGTATATVDVQWSESTDSWSATCTSGCSPTGLIRSVSICDGSECGGGDNGWSYELIVDIQHSQNALACYAGTVPGTLSKVVYTTTVEDDGNEIDVGDCSEGASVSPVGDPFSATDSGAFECAFSCAASGASITITYE